MCIDAREVVTWWTLDPLALGTIALSTALYVRGVRALWRDAGRGHGVRGWEVAAFLAGQLTLLVALVSPVDRLSDILFSAHMTQHELVMLVAPPLVVLGRPLVAVLWALPPSRRKRVLALVDRPLLRLLSSPVVALVAHALAVWLWHLPVLFEGAMRSEAVHAVQHFSFFATAALFWLSTIRGRYGRAGYGLAVLFVFATAMHTSILGALVTLAGRAWYPIYVERGVAAGVDANDDQALAGLVMWIPGGVLLTLVALALFAVWLGEAGRRVHTNERRRRVA